jgi:valyl-tRNA synthetase
MMAGGLAQRYEFSLVEPDRRARWEATGVHRWDPDLPRDQGYVVDTPPPTVSGTLHIGHVFSYTQTDIVARFRRMRGANVFYPMGFDDNGLPTERLVEKLRDVKATQMPRADFIRICNEVVIDAERDFRDLFRRIGLSVDWAQEYQTISAHSRRVSQLSALDLYGKGHLYRRPEPTLWDPADRTALAQAEVVDRELDGVMHDIRFALDGGGEVVIASTRPELLAACVAVMVHPDDATAAGLIGRTAITPLFGVPVPIIADDRVNPEKGTGRVMCCTFGDTTDIDWWRRHALPTRVVVDLGGRLLPLDRLGDADWPSHDVGAGRAAGAELAGLTAKQARKKAAEMLTQADALVRAEAIRNTVPCAERSGAPLEILVTPQWFVRLLDKKDALLEIGRRVNWYPAFMRERYESWVINLKWDWCVSRQRYFGVPLPFWYSKRAGEEGRIIAPDPASLPIDPLVDLPAGYTRDEVEPDMDVMDTWATSSVSPQINAGGLFPGDTDPAERHSRLFPADLRPQAHEIIRTWAFYTIAKSMLHSGEAPWRDAAISGWCLAEDKTKMSKSKGNIVNPIQLLDRFGADPVRYWTATSRLGMDTAYSENVLQNGKRLVNKLWNAARFVGGHLDRLDRALPLVSPADDIAAGRITRSLDRALIARLGETIATVGDHFTAYDYADALREAERFFWADFCDDHLELVKTRAYGEIGDAADHQSAIRTLHWGLDAVLRLFAPFVPFVTDALHEALFGGAGVHARGAWPDAARYPADPVARALADRVAGVLAGMRKFRTANGLAMNAPLARAGATLVEGDGGPLDLGDAWADLRATCHVQAPALETPAALGGEPIVEGGLMVAFLKAA